MRSQSHYLQLIFHFLSNGVSYFLIFSCIIEANIYILESNWYLFESNWYFLEPNRYLFESNRYSFKSNIYQTWINLIRIWIKRVSVRINRVLLLSNNNAEFDEIRSFYKIFSILRYGNNEIRSILKKVDSIWLNLS